MSHKPRYPSAKHVRAFLAAIGVPRHEFSDPTLDLGRTPERVAKMFSSELLAGYAPGALGRLKARFTKFDADGKDALVLLGPTTFHSLCSHHLLPFIGEAFVGYLPGRSLIGASKTAHVVRHYSQMLQIQERLTRQVADFLYEEASAKAVVVLMRASHECMRCRGVRQPETKMVTTSVRPLQAVGDDSDITDSVLREFYEQLRLVT